MFEKFLSVTWLFWLQPVRIWRPGYQTIDSVSVLTHKQTIESIDDDDDGGGNAAADDDDGGNVDDDDEERPVLG